MVENAVAREWYKPEPPTQDHRIQGWKLWLEFIPWSIRIIDKDSRKNNVGRSGRNGSSHGQRYINKL